MSLNIFNKKTTIPIILVALLGSTGLGVHGTITDVQSNDELFQHISSENPHLGTKIKLESINIIILENKENVEDMKNTLNRIELVICSHEEFNCQYINTIP